ncbi:MAG: hypothetical protein P8188_19145 [Gemmatimonadota bacterium]
MEASKDLDLTFQDPEIQRIGEAAEEGATNRGQDFGERRGAVGDALDDCLEGDAEFSPQAGALVFVPLEG